MLHMDSLNIPASGIAVPESVLAVSRPRKSYMDASLASISAVIDNAKGAFLRLKEERKVRELYDKINRLRFIPEQKVMNEDMYQMLESLHIHRESLPEEIKRFEILLKTRCINGVGFWNENGGIAFYSPLIGGIATIGEEGLTMIYSKKNQKSQSICVFENFLDYLSYRMLMSLDKRHIDSDVLILNSVCNFLNSMFECENYKHVLCFFRKGEESSEVMSETFTRRMVGVSKDMSYIYSDSNASSLLELIGTMYQEENI